MVQLKFNETSHSILKCNLNHNVWLFGQYLNIHIRFFLFFFLKEHLNMIIFIIILNGIKWRMGSSSVCTLCKWSSTVLYRWDSCHGSHLLSTLTLQVLHLVCFCLSVGRNTLLIWYFTWFDSSFSTVGCECSNCGGCDCVNTVMYLANITPLDVSVKVWIW